MEADPNVEADLETALQRLTELQQRLVQLEREAAADQSFLDERDRLRRIVADPDDFPDVDMTEIRRQLPVAEQRAVKPAAHLAALEPRIAQLRDDVAKQAALTHRLEQEAAERRRGSELELEVRALRERVDAYDHEQQDARRSRRERLDERRRWAAGCFSASASLMVFVYFWHPVSDLQVDTPRWNLELFFALPLLAGGAAASTSLFLAQDPQRWWRFAAAALLMPVLGVAVWAVEYRPNHAIQTEAMSVWERYTHRFPRGQLGEPDIIERYENWMVMCAVHRGSGDDADDDNLCLEIHLGRRKGSEVAGGWHSPYVEDAGDRYENLIYSPYDCFGDTQTCDNAER